MSHDIPISEFMVIWQRTDKTKPALKMVTNGKDDDKSYPASWGNCNLEVKESNDADKLKLIFAKIMYLALEEKIPIGDIHDQFSRIPEYRKLIADYDYHILPTRYHQEYERD
jgi:hypothetical protein